MQVSPEKPIFAMILPSCRGRAIGDNAIRRAVAISDHFQVCIISNSFPDTMPAGIKAILVKPKRFDFLRRLCHVPNEIAFALAARAPLSTLARTGRLAFVLCHGYTPAFFDGLWLRRKNAIPFGMFMHGHIFERPKGTYDPLTTWFYRKLAPYCYQKANLVFALSREQAGLAVKAGAMPESVVVTPNGFDLDDISLTKKQVKNKIDDFRLDRRIKCLYVGRLSVEKGVDVLLQACALLCAAKVDFCLDIVGGGPMEQRLRELCADLKLDESRVRFNGALKRHELGNYYLDHEIQFVPSISEPQGNVVMEGMAAGCLVIASDTGGIRDMIKHNVTGLLIEPGQPQLLAQGVIEMLNKTELAKSIVEAGFRWQQVYGSWGRIGELIIEATKKYQSLAAEIH